jgi:hypothetical protein
VLEESIKNFLYIKNNQNIILTPENSKKKRVNELIAAGF